MVHSFPNTLQNKIPPKTDETHLRQSVESSKHDLGGGPARPIPEQADGDCRGLMSDTFDGTGSLLWDQLLTNQVSLFGPAELTYLSSNRSWQRADTVIDVGCGNGKYLAELASAFPDKTYLGIDTSGELIATANRRHAGHNVTFCQRDIVSRPLEKTSDIIVLRFVVQHLERHSRFFQALRNLASETTRVLVVEPSLSHCRAEPPIAGLTELVTAYDNACMSMGLPRSRIDAADSIADLFGSGWEVLDRELIMSSHERCSWSEQLLLGVFNGWIQTIQATKMVDWDYPGVQEEVVKWAQGAGKRFDFALGVTILGPQPIN